MANIIASAPAPSLRHGPVENRPPERRFPCRHTYGAVDLGTNNCRLLIAKPVDGGFTVVDAFSRIVRLGEGLAHSGSLSAEAMDRAVGALSICADKLRRRNVSLVRSVATEACRRAENGEEFVERVRRETGIVLDIIEPQERSRSKAPTGSRPMAGCGSAPAGPLRASLRRFQAMSTASGCSARAAR